MLKNINLLTKTKHINAIFHRSVSNKIQPELKSIRKKCFGQPSHETHPHLIAADEVLPLITVNELQDRRQRLVESIVTYSKCKRPELKKHIIIIPSATKSYMSDKIPYVFRQNSDFLYLSGCQEPDTCLILTNTDSPAEHQATLFVRDQDTNSEIWDGPRTSATDAVSLFGVHQGLPMKELETFLQYFAKSSEPVTLWYDFMNPTQLPVQKTLKEYINAALTKVWDTPKLFIHRQRIIKSAAEQELMKKTCDIVSDAVINCIKMSQPGISEHQLFAQVEYDCKMRGAEYLAYPPVIAGGDRGTIIHYINNNQLVHNDELVLMDAGCEYHGYSSDITRTWPINGTYTNIQKAVYEAVLDTQESLIKMLHNMPTLDKLFDAMCLKLGNNLQEVGLISKSSSQDMKMREAFQFCPHHVSHYLGMDVHDTALIPRNIPIKPGMVITIEPGVYISRHLKVPKEFQGLGIRIEDDVLITDKGPVVLTAKCPKTISDIEGLHENCDTRCSA